MSDMMNNTSLDQRAAAALERARAANPDRAGIADHAPVPDMSQNIGETPDAPQVTMPTSPANQAVRVASPIAPPPTAEEMAAHGAVTGEQVAPQDDDEVILAGNTNVKTEPLTESDEEVILTSVGKDQMKNMPEAEQNAFLESIMPELAAYKKQLILEMGMTPAEAAVAAQNRMKTKAEDAAKKYGEENPDGVILTIDKSQEAELKLDEETTRKMRVAKALKLVVVESQELEMIKVKPVKTSMNMSQIRDICGSLSHYSVPLLEFGDYATFNGAQTGALANATASKDDDFLDVIEKKASLLYKYFDRGTFMSRFGEKNTPITYEQFCNWFCYDDIDMGIYAIVVASAMEVSESSYKCQNPDCGKVYNISYNNKALLDLSEIPESYQKRVEEIDTKRSSAAEMEAIHNKYAMHTRVKSPMSHNIYELGSPSIADVRNRIEACMEQIDGSTALDMILLLYVDKFWVYDHNDGQYALVDVGANPSEAFDILTRLHQVDLELLTRWIQDNKYHPMFKIKTKCPHCGRDKVDILTTDAMIFLHARASLTEIL